jgi:2-keto-4-pentenoate hydratase/2-oxohepta-3-ene-1,7-dioic acid hydratase in catechol pathway
LIETIILFCPFVLRIVRAKPDRFRPDPKISRSNAGGELRHRVNTRDLIFDIASLIQTISDDLTFAAAGPTSASTGRNPSGWR